MDSTVLDQVLAASPWTSPDGLQNQPAPGETVRPEVKPASGTMEQQTPPSSGGKAEPGVLAGAKAQGAVPGPAADQVPPVQQQNAELTTAAAPDAASDERAARNMPESKGPRLSVGLHTYAAQAGVAEQPAAGPQGPGQQSSGMAQPAAGAKAAPAPGALSPGRDGEAGKQDHEARVQESPGSTLPQGVGMSAAVAAEAQQTEAKPAQAKSALHENILSQVRDGVLTHDGKGNGQMSIRLNPGELGELKIQLRVDDNRLRVEVQADNKTVKDLLMNNLDSLKEALSSKNLSMEGFAVSTGAGGFNSPMPEQQGSPRRQNQARQVRAAGDYGQAEQGRVNYVNAETNNLLNVRF